MIRRKRIRKYIRRVDILWKAFLRYQEKIGARYITLDDEGRTFLEKCTELQREFVRYYPHPDNIRILRIFELLLYPSGLPPGGGEPSIIDTVTTDSVFFYARSFSISLI